MSLLSADRTRRLQVSLAFAFLVPLLPFLRVLAVNTANLQVPLLSLAGPVVLLSLGIFLFVWLLLELLPAALEKGTVLLLLFGSFVAWLQTIFFVGRFGFLDGRDVDWSQGLAIAWIQLAGMVLVGILVICKNRAVYEHAAFTSFLLILTSFGVLLSDIGRLSGEGNKYLFTKNLIYDFSENRNVVMFVLDTVQSDVVEELFSGDADLRRSFDGFTFFRNAVSAFPKTYASVPAILSGTPFDNSKPLGEYLRESYLHDSLPASLLEKGFDVRVHSWVPYSLLPDPQFASNVSVAGAETAEFSDLVQNDLRLLANLTLFRLAPHVLKPWVYNHGHFLIPPAPGRARPGRAGEAYCVLSDQNRQLSRDNSAFDALFFDEFRTCASVTLTRPVFRFFHLGGAHAPFQFDDQFHFVGNQTINRQHFKAQTHGVLREIAGVLEHLKKLGIFDRSTIVILGDHGGGDLAVGLNLEQEGLPGRHGEQTGVDRQKVMGGIPLVLVKKAGAEGELSRSDVPVSVTDLPRTIMREVFGEDGGFPGKDIYTLSPGEKRKRLHRFYEFSGWDIDYILPLLEYEVTGFSWYPESWRSSGRDLNRIAVDNYQGVLIDMGDGGSLPAYDPRGWRNDESGSAVITGEAASLQIHREMSGDLLVTMAHSEYPASAGMPETWQVSLGNRPLGVWSFRPGDGQRKKALLIPADLASRVHRDRLQWTTDSRDSLVRVKELRIGGTGDQMYEPGQTIDFSGAGNGRRFLTYGWAAAHRFGTLSLGYESGLLFDLGKKPDTDLVMTIELNALIGESWPEQEMTILVNGSTAGQYRFRGSREQVLSVEIPGTWIRDTGILDIRFRFANPVQPRWMGDSTDSRYLAITLQKLTIGSRGNEAGASVPGHAGMTSYGLISGDDGDQVVDAAGRVFPTGAESVRGYLDAAVVSGSDVRITGWAVDTESKSSEPQIVLFADGVMLTLQQARLPRPGVAKYFRRPALLNSGFSFSIPLPELADANSIRLFAVTRNGKAAELDYPHGFDWQQVLAGETPD